MRLQSIGIQRVLECFQTGACDRGTVSPLERRPGRAHQRFPGGHADHHHHEDGKQAVRNSNPVHAGRRVDDSVRQIHAALRYVRFARLSVTDLEAPEAPMYCPSCGLEYREGVTTCDECDVTLTPDPPRTGEEPRAE